MELYCVLVLAVLHLVAAVEDGSNSNVQLPLAVSAPPVTAPAGSAPSVAVDRLAHSSQRATELLVSSWNDADSWTKRNDTSSICERDVERAIEGYINNEMWALRMFDAWAKPGPSLLDGWSVFVGNYYQCRDIKAPTEVERVGYNGNYCVVTFDNFTNIYIARKWELDTVVLGTCMPDSCSQDDVTRIFNERLQALEATQFLQAVSTDCRTEEREYTTFTKLALLLLLVIGTFSFLGTIIDLVAVQFPDFLKSSETDNKDHTTSPEKQSRVHTTNDLQGFWVNVLLSFSIYTNGRRLLSTSQPPGSINVIPGIRFLTTSWIVVGHSHILLVTFYAANRSQVTETMANNRIFDLMENIHFGVDSFFAISGFLVSYLTIKQVIDKGWGYNWRQFYLHRYWRLTPTLLVVFIFVQGFQRFFVSGAMAPTNQPMDKVACEKKWLLLPLLMNNYLQTGLDEYCFAHSWSVSVDFQFYLLSPLMLIPFYYHKKAGIVSCIVFTIAQWILAGFLNYRLHGILGTAGHSAEWYQHMYYGAYCRIGPFAIGILSGYILSASNGRVSMSWPAVVTGWLVATAVAITLIFGFHGAITGEATSSLFVASVVNATYRSIWGAMVCWVIIACVSGYGGPVTALLSWPPFLVLGRLSYIVYLVHTSLTIIILDNLEQPQYWSLFAEVVFGTVGLVFSFLVSAILYVCVELPTFNLEKVLRGKEKTD